MSSAPYDLILFDADDTLFDFRKSEAAAFQSALAKHEIDQRLPELYDSYKAISLTLWQQLERDEITKDQLKVRRFELLFDEHSIDQCPVAMSQTYLEHLPQTVHLIDQAKELCYELSRNYEVGIITNGIDTVQRIRLERSGLKDYISFMVVSEQCGYNKPDRRIFDHAFTQTKNPFKKALMIGDRLESDIAGATNAEIDSCWFNPHGLELTKPHSPTYQIAHLNELREILS